jgi:hypothetical protein
LMSMPRPDGAAPQCARRLGRFFISSFLARISHHGDVVRRVSLSKDKVGAGGIQVGQGGILAGLRSRWIVSYTAGA